MIVHANEILRPMNNNNNNNNNKNNNDDEEVDDNDDAAARRIQLEICRNALSDLSRSWLVAELCLDIALPVLDRLQLGRKHIECVDDQYW